MKTKGIYHILLIVLFLLAWGCEYEKEQPQAVLTNVSFSSNVLPIFSSSCSTTGCHSSGANAPDLTAANAYTSLVDGGYIDTVTVENSEIYKRMIDKQNPMPPAGNLSQNEINVIYSWIKNGAPNN